jgi:hypothetical protein
MQAAAVEVVQGALQGYNGTVMCYGQTGAGVQGCQEPQHIHSRIDDVVDRKHGGADY